MDRTGPIDPFETGSKRERVNSAQREVSDLKFWEMGVGPALLVISALSVACTGSAVSQATRLVTPESAPAESSIPALTPIQSPAPVTAAPQPDASEPSTALATAEPAPGMRTRRLTASEQASDEPTPDDLSAYALSRLAFLSQTRGRG